MNDDDDDEEYKFDMIDNVGLFLDDIDYELDLEEYFEWKFLVFEFCLKLFLKFCLKCGGIIFEFIEIISGSMFLVKMLCVNNYLISWNL